MGELPICASLQTDREAEDVEEDQRRRSRRDDHNCREGAIVTCVCVRESRLERQGVATPRHSNTCRGCRDAAGRERPETASQPLAHATLKHSTDSAMLRDPLANSGRLRCVELVPQSGTSLGNFTETESWSKVNSI